jgi:hypothetical protein
LSARIIFFMSSERSFPVQYLVIPGIAI